MPLKPENVRNAADARRIVDERGITHVKVGVFDIDGILRGKYMAPRQVLLRAREGLRLLRRRAGLGLQRPALRQRHVHRLAHGLSRRAGARRCPTPAASCRSRTNTLFFLGEFAGHAEPICPRGLLRRVLGRAATMGFAVQRRRRVRVLHVRRDARLRAREGLPRTSTNMTPGFFGYSVLRSSVHAEFYHELLSSLPRPCASRSRACTPRPGRACSRRPSTYDEALEAADKAALFKTFTKVLAQRRGLMATFMAKWSQQLAGPERPHPRLAAGARTARRVFHDAKSPHGMSRRDALVRRRPAGADAGAAGAWSPAR